MSEAKPGTRRSSVVGQLREAALREVRVIDASAKSKGKPAFDTTHDRTPPNDFSADDFDRSNGVAQYAGPNIDHIGNGSGGPR